MIVSCGTTSNIRCNIVPSVRNALQTTWNGSLRPFRRQRAVEDFPFTVLPGNVNFCFEGIEGESLLLLLDDKGIEASSGSACTSGSLDPSHVLLAIGRVHDVAHGSLRLSIGEDLSDEDTEYIIRSVTEVVEYLRSFSPIWRDLESGKKPHIL